MNWKQRLAVAWICGLAVVAVGSATVVPAGNLSDRLLHALVAVLVIGLFGVLVMFLLFFVLGVREYRAQKREDGS